MSGPEGTALWILSQLSSRLWQPLEKKGSNDTEQASGKKVTGEGA